MPTDSELIKIADMGIANKTSLPIYRREDGKFSDELLTQMKEYVDITHVYGVAEGYNSAVNIPYVLCFDDQIKRMILYIDKQNYIANKSKRSLLEIHSIRRVYIGVHKEDGELLSTVTDPKKIIFGGS